MTSARTQERKTTMKNLKIRLALLATIAATTIVALVPDTALAAVSKGY